MPGCTIICGAPGPDVYCAGCNRDGYDVYVSLDHVNLRLDVLRSLWRDLNRGEVAQCMIDGAPEAPLYSGRYSPYLALQVYLQIEPDGAAVISKVEADKILSTDAGQHNWPTLEPDITACLENVLSAVRVKVGRPIEPGTVTLSVSISRGTKRDWPDPLKPRGGSSAASASTSPRR